MKPTLILFASQTGTAEELARDMDDQIKESGIPATCHDVYDCEIHILQEHSVCLLFASTWGEGEPPDDAADFYNNLDQAQDFNLSHLRFAVFGLGDSAYDEFNECGKNFDRMLNANKAERLLPRVDCDIDIDGPFEEWSREILELLTSSNPSLARV